MKLRREPHGRQCEDNFLALIEEYGLEKYSRTSLTRAEQSIWDQQFMYPYYDHVEFGVAAEGFVVINSPYQADPANRLAAEKVPCIYTEGATSWLRFWDSRHDFLAWLQAIGALP